MATDQATLHHDVLLTNYVQHWTPPKDMAWYLHDKIFPVVTVDKATNAYKVINQSTFMQTARAAVGPRGDVGAVQAYYDPEGSYKTVPYALDGIIDHLERDEADDVAMYEQLATDLPMTVLKNSLELDAFNVLFTTANLGTNYETVPSDQMFDQFGSMTSNPIYYIRAKCEKIMNFTGRKVNFMAIDRLVWRALKFNPSVQAIAPVHTTPAGLQEITIEMFEKKLEDVMEPGSIHVDHFRYSKVRGPVVQSSLAPVSGIGSNMILARLDPPSREDISAAKCFAFVGQQSNGAALLAAPGFGGDVPIGDDVASAPIAAFTYPIFDKGQRGATGVRVLTNRVFQIVRTSSLFVSFGCVNKNDAANYSTELL